MPRPTPAPPMVLIRDEEARQPASSCADVEQAAINARRIARETGKPVHVYVHLETFPPPSDAPAGDRL